MLRYINSVNTDDKNESNAVDDTDDGALNNANNEVAEGGIHKRTNLILSEEEEGHLLELLLSKEDKHQLMTLLPHIKRTKKESAAVTKINNNSASAEASNYGNINKNEISNRIAIDIKSTSRLGGEFIAVDSCSSSSIIVSSGDSIISSDAATSSSKNVNLIATSATTTTYANVEEEMCAICLDVLQPRYLRSKASTTLRVRWLCCGNVICKPCHENMHSHLLLASESDHAVQSNCIYCRSPLPSPGEQQLALIQGHASNGKSWAQYNMGEKYYHGNIVEQSYRLAFQWFLKAAVNGNIDANVTVGKMILEGEGTMNKLKSDTLAFSCFKKVADDTQDAVAQHHLGNCYYNGIGTEKNIRAAFNLYLLSATKGFMEAQYQVGLMFMVGEGVDQSAKDAITWFTLASKQGYTPAQCNLGVLLCVDNKEFAIKCKASVSSNNNTTGRKISIGKSSIKLDANKNGEVLGGEMKERYDEGVKWLSLAAMKGDQQAKHALKVFKEKVRVYDETYGELRHVEAFDGNVKKGEVVSDRYSCIIS